MDIFSMRLLLLIAHIRDVFDELRIDINIARTSRLAERAHEL